MRLKSKPANKYIFGLAVMLIFSSAFFGLITPSRAQTVDRKSAEGSDLGRKYPATAEMLDAFIRRENEGQRIAGIINRTR